MADPESHKPVISGDSFQVTSLTIQWTGLGLVLFAISVVLTVLSSRFGYDFEVADMPVLLLVTGLVLAGVGTLFIPFLVIRASALEGTMAAILLAFMLAAGLAIRLIYFASEPMLEDDYQRYLWDGAVTAHGLSAYAVRPSDAKHSKNKHVRALAQEFGPIIDRINHPDLRTIYPPVTQSAFALAYMIKPWSLTAWRLVCLVFDCVTLGLLLLLLQVAGRSPFWAALYWWNPVVAKELINSAHMESILLPFVLGAIILAIKGRAAFSVISLGVAVGIKVWPVLLLPIVLRASGAKARKAFLLAAAFLVICAVLSLPIVVAGLDSSSGFVAYVQNWKTNSAFFPAFEVSIEALLHALSVDQLSPALAARGLIGAALICLAVWLALTAPRDALDIVRRCGFFIAALFLLSPAQFPWYFVWVVPFLAFWPSPGLLALTVTLPLYYSGFYFIGRGDYDVFNTYIVWIIWVPVWVLLFWGVLTKHGSGGDDRKLTGMRRGLV